MNHDELYAPASVEPGSARVRLGLYLCIVVSPVLLALATSPESDHPFTQEIAKGLALAGYAILAMQFVLAARLDWIARPFGLDAVYAFHRRMGIYAGMFLLAHPLLYASADAWSVLRPMNQPWAILAGQAGAVVLLFLVVGAAARRALRLDFETWRSVHNVLALLLLGLGFVHSWFAGGDFANWPMRILWLVLLGVSLTAFLHHKWIMPRRCRGNSSRIAEVVTETPDVWTLVLRSPHTSQARSYLPGQFIFLTLYRDGARAEDHPFSLSSSPLDPTGLTVTIKAAGDYTATIGATSVGDHAAIRGPFGRFSHVLHPNETDLVFVAGGIGVTPFLSMLRYMRDTSAEVNVVLIYANRTESDIVARAELDAIAAAAAPTLTVRHVLSSPSSEWTGERGRVDATRIGQYVEDVSNKVFYVSGPPQMIDDISFGLRRLGVQPENIRAERFAL